MNECYDYIEKIYKHPKIDGLIKSIKPTELQDDLRQEMAIALLDYDCNKLIKINKEGKLIAFAISVVWKMGTLQNGKFYNVFKKNNLRKAIEYTNTQIGDEIPDSSIELANKILNTKLQTSVNDAHESIIFKKYIELKNCEQVAKYFGIPRLHVFKIVNKTKEQLKKAIRNDN